MKWLQFLWRCRERSWTISGPDLRNACVETEAILRALFSKHKFSNWHKTKCLFIRFSFMTDKQIKKFNFLFFFCSEIFPLYFPTLYFSTSVIIFQIKALHECCEWFKSRPRYRLTTDYSRFSAQSIHATNRDNVLRKLLSFLFHFTVHCRPDIRSCIIWDVNSVIK